MKFFKLFTGLLIVFLGSTHCNMLSKTPALLTSQLTYTLKKEDFSEVLHIVGQLQPQRSTYIAPSFPGYIKKLYVSVGQKVKKGAPIVSMSQSYHDDGTKSDPTESFPQRAQFDGVISSIPVQQGQYVISPYTDIESNFLVRIDDRSSFYVDILANETEIVRIKKNMTAVVEVASLPSHSFKAHIQEISMAPDTKNKNTAYSSRKTFLVRLIIEDPIEDFLPGLTAVAHIEIQKKSQTLLVPHEYILLKDQKTFVLGSSKELIPVKIGAKTSDKVEIVSGLEEGATILSLLELPS